MIRIAAFILMLFMASARAQTQPEEFTSPEDCGIYRYKAIIVRVIDGDTVVADISLGFNIWKREEHLRLWGINTPEIKGESRREGIKAREALSGRVLDKEIVICTIKNRKGNDSQGKFGRYLAILWDGGENLNGWLLKNGFAEEYRF